MKKNYEDSIALQDRIKCSNMLIGILFKIKTFFQRKTDIYQSFSLLHFLQMFVYTFISTFS